MKIADLHPRLVKGISFGPGPTPPEDKVVLRCRWCSSKVSKVSKVSKDKRTAKCNTCGASMAIAELKREAQ